MTVATNTTPATRGPVTGSGGVGSDVAVLSVAGGTLVTITDGERRP